MKIFKRIGLIALAICLGIGSLFITMPQKSNKYASADVNIPQEGYTFVSSNIINALFASVSSTPSNPSFTYLLQNSYVGSEMRYFNTSFKFTISNGYLKLYIFSYLTENIGLTDVVHGTGTKSEYVELLSYNLSSSSNPDYDVHAYSGVRVLTSNGNKWTMIGQSVTNNNDEDTPFEFPVVSVEIGNYTSPQFSEIVGDYTYSIIIRYTTISNHSITFFIPTWSLFEDSIYNAPYYEYRKYYLNEAFDFSNNGYYNQGLADGNAQGLVTGYNNGYTHGSTDGYQQGFQAGRVDGIESAGEYTFLGLIGAVVDAPVSVFKTMFNFNLLGVNMRDFFLALLTFSFILVAVKFIFMRK